jgi:hypothetical protein
MKREMWASFDDNYNRIITELLKDIEGVRCEVRGLFVSIFYEDEDALKEGACSNPCRPAVSVNSTYQRRA